jgi:methylated-DNA-[protein]-cysteine S-methyltransferase
MSAILHLSSHTVETPIGCLWLAVDAAGDLRVALFGDNESIVRRQLARDYGESRFVLEAGADTLSVRRSVARYFEGDLQAIDSISVATAGTPFQREVWSALRQIPCGATTSYGALARRIGRPAAVRAVGLANGSNPIAVIVPCHRVIGADGSLTGYGGGLERKRWLLRHERSRSLF